MSPSELAAAPPLLCPRCEAGIQPAARQLIEGGGTRHCFGRHDLGRRRTWLGVGVGVGVGGIGVSVGVGARGWRTQPCMDAGEGHLHDEALGAVSSIGLEQLVPCLFGIWGRVRGRGLGGGLVVGLGLGLGVGLGLGLGCEQLMPRLDLVNEQLDETEIVLARQMTTPPLAFTALLTRP